MPLGDEEQTPRSMLATERAIADIAATSAEKEEEAAMLTARKEHAELLAAECAATARSAAAVAAQDESKKAEAEQAAVAAATCKQAAVALAAQADSAMQKAAIEHAAVAASTGVFELVSHRGFGRFVSERYEHEADARDAASQMWWSWILYLEQRGAKSEVASGGYGFTHSRVRRHVSQQNAVGIHKLYGRLGS